MKQKIKANISEWGYDISQNKKKVIIEKSDCHGLCDNYTYSIIWQELSSRQKQWSYAHELSKHVS